VLAHTVNNGDNYKSKEKPERPHDNGRIQRNINNKLVPLLAITNRTSYIHHQWLHSQWPWATPSAISKDMLRNSLAALSLFLVPCSGRRISVKKNMTNTYIYHSSPPVLPLLLMCDLFAIFNFLVVLCSTYTYITFQYKTTTWIFGHHLLSWSVSDWHCNQGIAQETVQACFARHFKQACLNTTHIWWNAVD